MIDIKYRCIPVALLWIGTGLTIVARMMFRDVSITLWILGAVVGAIFILVSKGTREAFGYGDSWLILLLGIYKGLWQVLSLLLIAFFICGIAAIICSLKKCTSKNTTIPFIPFLVIGFLGVMIFEI